MREEETNGPAQERSESEARLAADLAGMRRLYDLHARLANKTDLYVALDEILAAAVEFTGTERGTVQLVSEDGERLEIAVHRGYGQGTGFTEHFLNEGSKPACDAARRRLIIEDVETFSPLAGTKDREVALADGIRATQSTPMIRRKGELVGVLSTQFPRPPRPSDHELRLIDLLAWSAADFVERYHAEAELRGSEERQRFLLKLSDALRMVDGTTGLQQTSCRLLGEHLGADRVHYVEQHDDEGTAIVGPGFYREGLTSLAGQYPLADASTRSPGPEPGWR